MKSGILSGSDERAPVLFVGPEGCRVAPRNSELRSGETLVDHSGLDLQVRMNDVVKVSVEISITDVESIGPDVAAEFHTTWQGKRYRMVEVNKVRPIIQDSLSIKPVFNLP